MDRQLKQTAFFGTEHRSRPLERHYKAPGTQAPLPDIACRVVIGGCRNTTSDTLEFISCWSVPPINQAAARAPTAGVSRIHEHNGNSLQHRLIDDQAAQFVESPVCHPRPLVPFGLDPVPDAMEIFQGNQAPTAFGIGDDGFTQNVVGVALETRLPARYAPERALGGPGSDLLQGSASGMLAAADGINLSTGVGLAAVINGKIDDAHVYADRIVGADQRRFIGITGHGKHPLAANEHQIDLTLGTLQHLSLTFAAGKRDALPALQCPDRHRGLLRQKPKDTIIVGLGCMSSEDAASFLIASLQTIGDFADAPNRRLRSKPKVAPKVRVSQPVQIELAPFSRVKSSSRKPVTGRVTPLQGRAQQLRLLWRRKQSDGSYQLHRSGTLLGFYVEPNYTTVGNLTQVCRATTRPNIPSMPKGAGLSRSFL